MDFQTLGQRLRTLRTLRTLRQLSQAALAAMVRVGQGHYNRWELDAQPVPAAYLPALAAALGVELGLLAEVHAPGLRGGQRLPGFLAGHRKRLRDLPPYDVQGTVDEMLDLSDAALDAYAAVERRLSRANLTRMALTWRRDSPAELLAAFQILKLDARLVRMTLAQVECPALAVEDNLSTRSAAYLRRDVLVLERPELCAVFFPQVWVVSIVQAEWYRLDLLCYVRDRKGTERWADFEVDGYQHEQQTEQDERRARGIGLPRIRFWTREVAHRDFGGALIARLATLLTQPPPSFTVQPKATRR